MNLSDLASKAGGLIDKAADALPDSVKDQAGTFASKAGDLIDKANDLVPDSVKAHAGSLADKATHAATEALGKAADALSKK